MKLADVTLQLSPVEEWEYDPRHLQYTDDLDVDVSEDGDTFEIIGQFHLRTSCDTYGLSHVFVEDRVGNVVIDYVEQYSCDGSDRDTYGHWFAQYVITGEFVGAFDSLIVWHRNGHVAHPDFPSPIRIETPVP
ncbi:hypothetical protein C475_22014 [Halosimplex carlsbadense 2-9-1]|uniref:Uncharacterized protein n=2 Tax=Halosimplex carlsbadense TaxID=171164 RepID=M0C8S6_9EURY|nr:hypothetical protein C475_22014 [Halosimplex carlsbadense 2-9-1]